MTTPPVNKGGRPFSGRAKRIPISIRIDPDVLEALRDEADLTGVPYQTLINNILAVRGALFRVHDDRRTRKVMKSRRVTR